MRKNHIVAMSIMTLLLLVVMFYGNNPSGTARDSSTVRPDTPHHNPTDTVPATVVLGEAIVLIRESNLAVVNVTPPQRLDVLMEAPYGDVIERCAAMDGELIYYLPTAPKPPIANDVDGAYICQGVDY